MSNSGNTNSVIISHPDANPIIEAFGDQMILKLGSEDTNGKLCLWTNVTPPGGGPPPHYHDSEDELFLPQSGPVEFLLGSEWIHVDAGSTIFAPRGTVHAFRNPADVSLEMMIQTAPGGFDDFFRECAAEFTNGNPDMEKIVEISARYGIHYV